MAGLSDVIKNDLFPLVNKSAPLLAGVLGSPLAGVAVSLIANAFGANTQDIRTLVETINNDPDCDAKLKQAELTHAETLMKINSDNFALQVQDKQDARKYAGQYKDFLRHLAYLVTFGFFGALLMVFFPLEISPEEKNLLSLLVGMLASKWQTIIDFFFGSSSPNRQGETPK